MDDVSRIEDVQGAVDVQGVNTAKGRMQLSPDGDGVKGSSRTLKHGGATEWAWTNLKRSLASRTRKGNGLLKV